MGAMVTRIGVFAVLAAALLSGWLGGASSLNPERVVGR
jgi:hypothetical protein